MSGTEPQPLLVIRNQLLAFALLNLLGSCVHLPQTVAARVDKPATTITAPVAQKSESAGFQLTYRRRSPAL